MANMRLCRVFVFLLNPPIVLIGGGYHATAQYQFWTSKRTEQNNQPTKQASPMPSHLAKRPKTGIIVDVKKKNVLTGKLNPVCLSARSLPYHLVANATSAGGADLNKASESMTVPILLSHYHKLRRPLRL